MKNKILRILVITAAVLLVPFIGMQVSDEWNWSLFDFVIIGTLLIGTGALYELITMRMKSPTQRVLTAIVLLAALLLTWAHLAVGLF